jgi:hypothetical protein
MDIYEGPAELRTLDLARHVAGPARLWVETEQPAGAHWPRGLRSWGGEVRPHASVIAEMAPLIGQRVSVDLPSGTRGRQPAVAFCDDVRLTESEPLLVVTLVGEGAPPLAA